VTRSRLRLRFPRRSLRLRLTAWYAALFLVAGTALLTTSYFVVRSQFLPSEGFTIRVGPPGTDDEVSTAPEIKRLARPPAKELQQAQRQLEALNRRALRRTLVYFVLALGATTVASLGLGWVLAGRALRPVAQITATARRVSEENLDARIALAGPEDELKELADTFDAMLAKLDHAFESQRRFVANASHELRTPLAVMRMAVDVTVDDAHSSPPDPERLQRMATTLRGAIDRSEQLVERLLTLASGDRGLEHHEEVDLARTCREVLDELAPRGLDVELALQPAVVSGDRVLLRHLVANLLDNAIRHNRDGGRLQVACGPAPGGVRLVVANDGAPIPPAEVPSLLQPFRRLRREPADAVEGFGLGLAIVDSVTRAHGGELRLRARPEGGLEATATLPAVHAPRSLHLGDDLVAGVGVGVGGLDVPVRTGG
jgi:signal transduction histidine kinase